MWGTYVHMYVIIFIWHLFRLNNNTNKQKKQKVKIVFENLHWNWIKKLILKGRIQIIKLMKKGGKSWKFALKTKSIVLGGWV